MRIRLILLLITMGFCLTVSGQSLPDETRISYSCYQKPLDIVIKEISERSKVKITFGSNRISRTRKVTINARNETLETILTVILSKARMTYEVVGDQIVIARISRNSRKNLDPVISGYISDVNTGEPLIGANIFLSDNSKGTTTNEYGFYSMKMRRSTYRYQFSYVGYKLAYKQFYLGGDTIINLSLEPQALLNDVLISDNRTNSDRESPGNEEILTMDELSSVVSLGGETDVLRLASILPGISSGSDGLGGLNVRGGSADQNMVLLDGVPVYNAGHALGLYSIFNSNIVKNVKVLKGSFPARYGGRLSSVIDIRTKDGSIKEHSGEASLSTLAAKVYAEGPLGRSHSYLISGRRTFIDPWLKEASKFINEQNGDIGAAGYYFYDLNAKVNLQITKTSKLILSAYMGGDEFSNNVSSSESNDSSSIEKLDNVKWSWGNKVFYLRYNNQFGNKAFSNFTAYYSDYRYSSFEYDRFRQTGPENNVFDFNSDLFISGIEDFGLKYDLDYFLNVQNRIRVGFGAIRHKFTPGLVQVTERDKLFPSGTDPNKEDIEALIKEPTIEGLEFSAYAEDEIALGEGVKANLGLHSQFIMSDNKNYYYLQPRVSIVAQSQSLYFKGGISKMNQFLHLLSSNGLGLPSDVWLPSTELLKPSDLWVLDTEIGYKSSLGFDFGVGGYYKDFKNLISYGEGRATVISEESDWQFEIPRGNGTAYGIEVFFNKRIGRSTWFSNYTYSQSTRHFRDLNLNREFSFKFDRRHNFKLSFIHRITENAEFSLNWNLSSGTPYSQPNDFALTENQDGTLDFNFIYTNKNNAILPDYQRLDVGFHLYSDYGWGRQKISLGIYNLLNRKNPYYIDIDNVDGNIGAFRARQYSVLPIFPSLSYSLAF